MAQPMPLPLTVSCFSKIQIGFAFLVPAHLGSLRKGLLNGCVCVTLKTSPLQVPVLSIGDRKSDTMLPILIKSVLNTLVLLAVTAQLGKLFQWLTTLSI